MVVRDKHVLAPSRALPGKLTCETDTKTLISCYGQRYEHFIDSRARDPRA